MNSRKTPAWFLLCAAIAIGGCGEISKITGSTFHQKFGWKAEDYFTDPKVVALCHAIEADDLAEIDRLAKAGADVNAKGKDNMTPLLWAFPDNKLDRFKRLLELGADPNVAIQSGLNTHGGFYRGETVTHMASETEFPGYFEAVFEYGGDPNLIENGLISSQTPLFSVTTGVNGNKMDHVRVLIDKKADLNHMNGTGVTPVMEAVSTGQYNIALLLLEKGADYRIYMPRSNEETRFICVAMKDDRKGTLSPQLLSDYQKLVKWLEDRGESITKAKEDIKRWQSYNTTPEEYRNKMDAEIAEREVREASAKLA